MSRRLTNFLQLGKSTPGLAQRKGGSRSCRPRKSSLDCLETEPRGNLNLTWSVEETAVVTAGELLVGGLESSDTLGRGAARGQLIGCAVNTVVVLMVSDVEDVCEDLQFVPVSKSELLLNTNIINNLSRRLVCVDSDFWNDRRACCSVPISEDSGC